MNMDLCFSALADPTRRAILARLVQGEATVNELAALHALSQPAISKHLKVLEHAGLIETRVAAQFRPRRLRIDTLRAVDDWLGLFRTQWEARLDRLDALVSDQARAD